MTLNENIFNTKKSDYQNSSLFLGQLPGLADTVNKRYPKIWDLYKKMKSLDWDENEFDFSPCNTEFKTCSKSVYEIMIRTLAWQWEADSIAARMIAPIVAPFVTSTELWTAWQRVSDNEQLHAATYSEIVRSSFDNPDEVIVQILSVQESLTRLKTISDVMGKTYVTSHKLALGLVDRNSQDVYDDIFLFTVALYALERIQFMSSFAVTFAIADTGNFIPIGKAVQKICQDEYEIHVQLDKAILDYELQTDKGLMAFNKKRDVIERIINEVVDTELEWTDNLFSEGRELVGMNATLLKQWVLYNAKEVYEFFGIKTQHQLPNKNPIPFINDWIRIDAIQPSPQEERHGAYMLGAVVNDVSEENFDIDL